jgi:hypothetical protein
MVHRGSVIHRENQRKPNLLMEYIITQSCNSAWSLCFRLAGQMDVLQVVYTDIARRLLSRRELL